jgi:hypothetical protein
MTEAREPSDAELADAELADVLPFLEAHLRGDEEAVNYLLAESTHTRCSRRCWASWSRTSARSNSARC